MAAAAPALTRAADADTRRSRDAPAAPVVVDAPLARAINVRSEMVAKPSVVLAPEALTWYRTVAPAEPVETRAPDADARSRRRAAAEPVVVEAPTARPA